eukprot:1821045-Amphidinium_carterae.1
MKSVSARRTRGEAAKSSMQTGERRTNSQRKQSYPYCNLQEQLSRVVLCVVRVLACLCMCAVLAARCAYALGSRETSANTKCMRIE